MAWLSIRIKCTAADIGPIQRQPSRRSKVLQHVEARGEILEGGQLRNVGPLAATTQRQLDKSALWPRIQGCPAVVEPVDGVDLAAARALEQLANLLREIAITQPAEEVENSSTEAHDEQQSITGRGGAETSSDS